MRVMVIRNWVYLHPCNQQSTLSCTAAGTPTQGRLTGRDSRCQCQMLLQEPPQHQAPDERCELVVIGAGMAALHVLSRLPSRLLKVPVATPWALLHAAAT